MKLYIYILVLLCVVQKTQAQTPENISKPESGQSTYIVTGTETLTATQSITLSPGTHIQNGSDFVAKIVPDAYISVTTSSNENYIYSRVFQTGMTDVSGIHENKDIIESITYFDGLGRPMQSVNIKATPDKKDIITHIGYDDYGRQDKAYLPYATTANAGLYRTDALTATNSFYATTKYENTLNPYSEKKLEASPLSRVLEQAAPGADWALNETADTDPNNDNIDHTIKFEYTANTDADYIRQFEVDLSAGDPQLEDKGYYLPNQLYKSIIKDENWSPSQINFSEHTTEEYKDKQGRVLLKRTFDKQKWLDTYYVYDDYGNLTYVLSPKAVTLNTFNNPYYGDLGFYGDISNMLLTGGGYAEYIIWDTPDGFSISIEIIGFTEGTALKSGKIADLDFSPALLDVVVGNIASKDSNGNSNIAATLYIQDGDLYLNSTGTEMYSASGSGYYYETMYVDISNYMPNSIDSPILDGLCYQYKYDQRNRLIEKKIPGKGKEYIVYDNLDRPVLTQDANQRKSNNTSLSKDQWLFTKYDAFGRVIYTGFFNSDSSKTALQGIFNSKNGLQNYETPIASGLYYTNDDFPNSETEVLMVNYYDNYDFYGASLPSSYDGQDIINYNNADKVKTKGLATGSKVKVLETSHWITTVSGYDTKARPIYIKSVNDYLGTTDLVKSTLDFIGKVKKTITTHTKSGITITTTDTFTYDHMGRLVSQKQKINSLADELIVLNRYDELGQLENKKVGGNVATTIENSSGLQTIDYTYNIRGWLTQINNPTVLGTDLFTFKLNYNAPSHGATALYNGNISETEWRTNNTDTNLRWYKYDYDALNRLGGAVDNALNLVEAVSYNDKNGNIGRIIRKGFNENNSTYGVIDVLSYVYDDNSNRLLKVTDNASPINGVNTFGFKDGTNTGNDYTYDANGNMLNDTNKGITAITYNHLNLPTSVRINGSGGNGTISYIYDATGVKLEKKLTEGSNITKTFYAGNYVYKKVDSNAEELKFFNTSEGYFDVTSAPSGGLEGNYVYQYKDHLGNIRLSYKDNSGSLEILEENNYYPFGLKHKGYNNNPVTNHPYKFLGQEEQNELGLNWLTFRYRNYMPDIGRFFGVDPVSSEYMSISTYQFAHNNPIWKIELEGLEGQEKQGIDVSHHEPVKVVTKSNTAVGVGLISTKVVTQTTKKAAIELSKSFVDDAGRLVLQGSKASAGTILGALLAILTPTTMGSGTRFDDQGRDKTNPNYPNIKTGIDERLKVPDHKIKTHGDSDSPIRRIGKADFLHSEDLITGSEGYKEISGLTDSELIESVTNPENGDFVTINSKTGKIMDGNTRVYEILKRGLKVDIPVRIHNPNDSDYFYDIED